jgi:hypothetical protein
VLCGTRRSRTPEWLVANSRETDGAEWRQFSSLGSPVEVSDARPVRNSSNFDETAVGIDTLEDSVGGGGLAGGQSVQHLLFEYRLAGRFLQARVSIRKIWTRRRGRTVVERACDSRDLLLIVLA